MVNKIWEWQSNPHNIMNTRLKEVYSKWNRQPQQTGHITPSDWKYFIHDQLAFNHYELIRQGRPLLFYLTNINCDTKKHTFDFVVSLQKSMGGISPFHLLSCFFTEGPCSHLRAQLYCTVLYFKSTSEI